MLGLGRALGETMAVTFVIGNANRITTTLFGAGQHHRLAGRAGVPGERDGQPEAVGAAGARLHPVRDLLHRAGHLPLAAAAAAAEGAEPWTRPPLPADAAPRRDHRRRARPPPAGARPTWSRGALHRRDAASACSSWPRSCSRCSGAASAGSALTVFTQATRPPGLRRRPAERHRRQPDPDRARRADRHADRPAGRHLPGRVRARIAPRQRGALRLRRAALGAVDPDRPVRLPACWWCRSAASPAWAGCVALAIIVIPIVVRTTEDMLRLLPEHAARSGDRARRAEVEDDHPGLLAGGAGRASSPASCWRWRASRARPRRCCSPRSAT